MRTIHKYQAPLLGCSDELTLDASARVLAAGLQDGAPCLWVETETPMFNVGVFDVRCIGTGWEVPFGFVWCGTVDDGSPTAHYYWRQRGEG